MCIQLIDIQIDGRAKLIFLMTSIKSLELKVDKNLAKIETFFPISTGFHIILASKQFGAVSSQHMIDMTGIKRDLAKLICR
jgi:hypothetical protein